MHAAIAEKSEDLIDLCRRYGVTRLDVFGSAVRGADFDAATSDVDFLVQFGAQDDDLARFLDFKDALEALLGRPIDLVDRKAIGASRNYIRRRRILTGAEALYAPDLSDESWRDAALLLDMALAAEDALSFVADLDERAFLASDLHLDQVLRDRHFGTESAR